MREIDGRNEPEVRSLESSRFGDYGRLWTPTKQEILAHAERTRDFSRQHIDEEYAKSLGFSGLVVHGVLLFDMLTYFRPAPIFNIVGVSRPPFGATATQRWVRGVAAGEAVHGRERVSAVEYRPGVVKGTRSVPTRITLVHTFEVRNVSKSDELAMSGTFTVYYYLENQYEAQPP